MPYRDLRDFLDVLGGDLRRVAEPMSPRFEIAAALRQARPDAPASRALCRMVQKIDGLALDDFDAPARGVSASMSTSKPDVALGASAKGSPAEVAVVERPGEPPGARSRPE